MTGEAMDKNMQAERNQRRIVRWRLILGQEAQEKLTGISGRPEILNETESAMDRALSAIYDNTDSENRDTGRRAGLGPSYPNLAKWLTDIRSYFPEDTVSVIQTDAIERKGLTQLLFEPETLAHVKPDISMIGTLLILKNHIPDKAKDQARVLVRSLADDIIKLLESDIRRAVTGALNRRKHSPIPSLPNTDWKKTINKNLRHFDFEKKRIIPERFYFYENKRVTRDWNIILDIDQSGSMADSVIYASIMGSILASLGALETHIVAFDTEVVDLTEFSSDPVDILFGVQLGGGTDINKSVKYCSGFIHEPKKSMFILISDLYEGGVEAGLLRQLGDMKESGVKVIVLLALSDRGTPSYDEALAGKINRLGIPCFGCTPNKLPELLGGALKGDDLNALADRIKNK